MGLLLSILFSYVGAVELMLFVRDIVHQVGLHDERMKRNRISSNASSSSSLLDLQENLRKSLKSAQQRLTDTDSIQSMADGIQYSQGYRILSANEQELSKRWTEARASLTIDTGHDFSTNTVEFDDVRETTVNAEQNDDFQSNDSLRSSSLSVDTVIENGEISRLNGNADPNMWQQLHDNGRDGVPDIRFDEFSQDYLHALDGIKKGQRKTDEPRRRKGYKSTVPSGQSGDSLQRRRSEDIDGETDNPWGELKPESFHDAGLWTRERAMSIAENEEMMAFVDEKSYQESFKRATKQPNATVIDNGNSEFDESQSVSPIFSPRSKRTLFFVALLPPMSWANICLFSRYFSCAGIEWSLFATFNANTRKIPTKQINMWPTQGG